MSRLLFYLALAMIAYFLIRNKLGLGRTAPPPKPIPPAPPTQSSSPTRSYESADVVADPVCGTFVDPATAVAVTHNGDRHFFCSAACRDQFLAESRHSRS